MEDSNQNGKNQQIEALMPSQWSKNSDALESNRNLSYLAETVELVQKILSLSNQPNLTEKELGQRAKDWQDALEPVVPINRMHDAFTFALRKHTGTFPVNAFEIIEAYRQIRIDEGFGSEARATSEYLDRVIISTPGVPMPQSVEDALAEMKRKQA